MKFFSKSLNRAIPFQLGAILLASAATSFGHTNGHDYLHHWELASPDPDRIFLTFHGDPATSRAVTWRTDSSVTKAVAQIAPATARPDFFESAITFSATTETVDLQTEPLNQQEDTNYHSVVFDNLAPETLYAYRVGDGKDRWSEWIQFRTASKKQKPFSFVYFGDAQNDILSRWSRVIRMAYQKAPDASLVVHAGDLVNEGHFDSEWAEWFKAGSFIHSQWTGIPVLGNHEFRVLSTQRKDKIKTRAFLWRPQFTLPVEKELPETLHETVYTIDYQGVRFIVLDSMREVAKQAEYLEKQLKSSGAKWNIVVSHYSLFALKTGRGEEIRRLWKPILDKYGVDLMLQGHDHAYARGHVPVRATDGSYGSEFETMYVTSVSGPKQYEISPGLLESYAPDGYNNDSKAMQQQFFQVIDVDGNRLTYKAYTADGELFDEATIRKDPSTGKKVLE
ncbi:MAG: fibronectin type III domain-containing protein [Puniceicoccaceae bacterium]